MSADEDPQAREEKIRDIDYRTGQEKRKHDRKLRRVIASYREKISKKAVRNTRTGVLAPMKGF